MKKAFIILILLINLNPLKAQNIENLKFRDTLYLLIDLNENNLLKSRFHTNGIVEEYTFIYNDTSALGFKTSIKKKYKNDNFYEKKDFLLKEKSKIVTLDDLYKIEKSKIVYEFETKKIKVYIIDKKNNRRKKIYIKRAYLGNRIPIIE